MKVGITGTRNAVTRKQVAEIEEFLKSLPEGSELHHGDCVGADLHVAMTAQRFVIKTICHPPEKMELRAFHRSTEIRPEKSYLARNRDIVDEVELLMVVPMQMEWQPKGGTWYTHDYAKKKGVPVKVFWPEMTMDEANDILKYTV
jgi:hypothetical protein